MLINHIYMLQLILIGFFIGGIIVSLKIAAKNSRIKRYSKDLAGYAGSAAGFEALSSSFDTLIKQFPVTGTATVKSMETAAVQTSLRLKFGDRYTIRSVTQSQTNNDWLIAADAKTKDFVPSRSGGRYIDKLYPVSMLLKNNDTQLEFYGEFPHDKHHQMLQQDLAAHLHRLITVGVAV